MNEHQMATDRRIANIEQVLRAARASSTSHPPGLLFARHIKAMALAYLEGASLAVIMERQKHWPDAHRKAIANFSDFAHTKAAVAGTPAISGLHDVAHDFLAATRALSIVGRLQGLRRVPARVPLLTQNTGSTAHFTAQTAARKLSVGSYTRENLPLMTVAAMSVTSNELLANPSFESEMELSRDLAAACAQALDTAFIARTNGGDSGTPASVTNSAPDITCLGDTIVDLDNAMRVAIQALVAAGSNLASAAWVLSPTLAGSMSTIRTSNGDLAYPTLGANGGLLSGLPALCSASVEADSDGQTLALLDASQISYAEDAPNFSISRNATIEMDTAPTGDGAAPTAASQYQVSMFQADCTALLAAMAVNWKLRRTGCAQVIYAIPSTLTAS